MKVNKTRASSHIQIQIGLQIKIIEDLILDTLFKLANAPVCWISHQQKTVSLSSTEAEYMALSDCARQIRWIENLFGELGFPTNSIPLIGDNQGAIFLSSNEIQEKRTKHMDIHFHHLLTFLQKTWPKLNSKNVDKN